VAGRLTVARTLLPGSSATDGESGPSALPDAQTVRAVTTALQDAVEDGRLGYFATIARRDTPAIDSRLWDSRAKRTSMPR
jgi:hypothetical protein